MFKKFAALLILAPMFLSLAGCPCGFDCDRDDDSASDEPSIFTLGMSATAIEKIRRIVLEVDSITLVSSEGEDVVIDTFTIDDLNLSSSKTFQIDLLDYRGLKQLEVIEDLEIESGTYTEVVLQVLDGDVNQSFVEDSDGEMFVLNVSSSGLSLPGFSVTSGNEQLTIEFNLALALQFSTISSSYVLDEQGARIVDSDVGSSITGSVDSGLFDGVSPCDEKTDPLLGNLVYLYSGNNLSVSALADVYTGDSSTTIGDNAVAPYSVTALVESELTGAYEYAFGFLPEDEYTLILSCNALDDDPIDFDGISIPLPAEQLYEINLAAGEKVECDFEGPSVCSPDSQ